MMNLSVALRPFYPSVFSLLFIVLFRCVYLKWRQAFLNRTQKEEGKTCGVAANILLAAERPFKFLLNVLTVLIPLAWLPQAEVAEFLPFVTEKFMDRLSVFTDHIQRSVFVYSIFWCLFNLSDSPNGLMLDILKHMGLRPEEDQKHNIEEQKTGEAIGAIMSAALRALIVLIGLMIIVREWGYDISGFIASLSIGSAAVSFAAKDALANVFGSLVIILGRPFLVGDWIEVNGVEGTVEKITMRSTILRTFPQEVVHIPNSLMTNVPITNFNLRKKRRLSFTIGLTYDSSREQLEKTVEAMRAYFTARPTVFDPDDIRVHFTAFADSSLNIDITVFTLATATKDFLNVRQQTNLDLMKIMQEQGVGCAFPSTSVYFATPLETKPKA